MVYRVTELGEIGGPVHPVNASSGGSRRLLGFPAWAYRFGETRTSSSPVARTYERASLVGVGAGCGAPGCPLDPAFDNERRITVYSCVS